MGLQVPDKKAAVGHELDKEQKTTVVIDVAILSNNSWTSSGKWTGSCVVLFYST